MKLVIDLQGAQSSNRHRGIGRYSLALARAMARAAGKNELWIALNGSLPDAIDSIRAEFGALIPQERIVVWETPTPVHDSGPALDWRRRTGEILRESFLANLKPDMVHVSSLFEGLGENVVTSVGAFTNSLATAVTLYDLIPLIYRNQYLSSPAIEAWYQRKIGHMRRAGLWLAISESARHEGIDWLNLPPDKVVNISTAADTHFRPVRLGEDEERALRRRYGLTRPFVMYTGGIDHRKNIEGLINAYARLPATIRKHHQLAVVCSAREIEIRALTRHARHRGLAKDELVMTRFVPDDDLLALYNICTAFCFPSWHEGFGLPALEAMQCGAATIGANTSSVPEVIGRADALFDPHDENDMAARLHQVLTDSDYRRSLKKHGLQQARKFSWEETARRAWAAFEAHHEEGSQQARAAVKPTRRLRLAYVSPLPPERSGIAAYSAELLPELARHYDIDVIVDQPEVADSWIKVNCPIRTVEWFDHHAHRYDRILYQFGNSTLHRHMFDLIDCHPGVVVLHDFYLSSIFAHIELQDGRVGFWRGALYRSHGYHAVLESYDAQNPHDVIWKYPANFPVLQSATGIIVHSDYARRLAQHFYDKGLAEDWTVVPALRSLPMGSDRQAARKELGYKDGDFVVCSFGLTGPIKLSHRLLQAWLSSKLASRSNCHLVFVGGENESEYGRDLQRIISESNAKERIRVTGFVSPELYQQYLSAADAAVQLRAMSRGETSRAVLDCMAYGLPTIVNAHGAMIELPENCVVMLPDQFSDKELAAAVEALRANSKRREVLGRQAQAYVKEELSPRRIADQYYSAIERQSAHSRDGLTQRTMTELAAVEPRNANDADWIALARAMSRNARSLTSARQILVDVSELALRDAGTGIQRVTRSILAEMLANPPSGYRVEPVYATAGKPGYRYARRFAMRLLGCPEILPDAPVELKNGDILLGLDLGLDFVLDQVAFFSRMRGIGGELYFIIYDLLPLSFPHAFDNGLSDLFSRWFSTISVCADGIIGISRAVADNYIKWADVNAQQRLRPLKVGWFHLGADTDRSLPTKGLPDDSEKILANLAVRPSFLMVGTIEPRKRHEQVVEAFEHLWTEGVETNLVIVGKQGWKTEALVELLCHHPELGRRLIWLEGVSDEFLEKIYAASACLIAASENEGFGLPLVEAARHKLPILVRDIPVFREVAGAHASYFSGNKPADVVRAVKKWLALYAKKRHPKSDDLPWLTWAQSVDRLKTILFQGDWYTTLPPDKKAGFETDEASKMSADNNSCRGRKSDRDGYAEPVT